MLVWLPLALPIYLIGGRYAPNQAAVLALVLLYVEFLGLVWLWGQQVYRLRYPLRRLGLWVKPLVCLDWAIAALIGFGGVAALFLVEGLLGWIQWQPIPSNFGSIFVMGGLVSIAVGLAEELLFRGWLLFELEADYPPTLALIASSVIFALAHFIKPWDVVVQIWPQFFGLMLLGITLVWARRTRSHYRDFAYPGGKLGFPAGLHGGLVFGYYLVDVADLVVYPGTVPAWVTGVGGNPLAGILGFSLLGAIAFGFYQRAQRVSNTTR